MMVLVIDCSLSEIATQSDIVLFASRKPICMLQVTILSLGRLREDSSI